MVARQRSIVKASVKLRLPEPLRGRRRSAKLMIGSQTWSLISHRFLVAALNHDEPTQLVCLEDKTEKLDMVLSDSPISGFDDSALLKVFGENGRRLLWRHQRLTRD